MNILFIFSRHAKDSNDSTLTKDLADEFVRNGENVYILTMEEKRYNNPTQLTNENGCNVLRVKTGNYFNTNKFEKIKTILTLPNLCVKAAKKYLASVKIDLIIAHTPFVSSHKLVRPLRKFFACPAHLILWDIFPQNAKDIKILNNCLVIKLMRIREKEMMISYNQIWCMSNGNVNYIKSNYSFLKYINIDLLYNSAKIKPYPIFNRMELRTKYGYEDDDIIAIFGGNMGVPQQLENILNLALRCHRELPLVKFLFVGEGTETNRIRAIANDIQLTNTKFLPQVPRWDYELLLAASDIGLISLDQRFTVPNFPSKTTDYFKLKLPVFASIDRCSAQDYGLFLTEITNGGRFALAEDANQVFDEFKNLCLDKELRIQLGNNGRYFFETELDVELAYKKIKQSMFQWQYNQDELNNPPTFKMDTQI